MKIGVKHDQFAELLRSNSPAPSYGNSLPFDSFLGEQSGDEVLRYDASVTAKTRKFNEMPIVAPTRTPCIEVGNKVDDTPIYQRSNEYAGTDNPWTGLIRDIGSEMERQFEGISIKFESGPEKLSGIQLVGSCPDHIVAASNDKQILLQTTRAERTAQGTNPSARNKASTIKFSIHALQTATGVRIFINGSHLSEQEQVELASKIAELARGYGMPVDDIRIFNFPGSS